jgi:hypothetical protein
MTIVPPVLKAFFQTLVLGCVCFVWAVKLLIWILSNIAARGGYVGVFFFLL